MSDKEIYLSQDRYLVALGRIRNQIAKGSALSYYDDTTCGSKDTSCTWGLCSSYKEQWPDAEDHLWPDQFKKFSRVAPLYCRSGQSCPLDKQKSGGSGCFYSCRIFKNKRNAGIPSREEAVKLYDETISEATQKEGS